MVSTGHVLAGSPVHAGVGLTLVVIDVTVWAAPTRVTGTFVASTQRKCQVSYVFYLFIYLMSFIRATFCCSFILNLDLCSPVDEVLASAVDAGVAATLVHLRQTGGVVVALWAQAGKAVDAINTRAPVVTGVDDTLIDVDVTH